MNVPARVDDNGRPRDAAGRFLSTRVRGEVVERRDPKAALTQTSWLGRDQPQVPEWNADQALRYGLMANVIAFRCVQIRAEVASSFPIRVGPVKPERPGESAEFDQNHPLARLLGPPPGGPNPNTSGRALVRWSLVQRIATGRQCWEIEWTGPAGRSQVAGFWPIPAPQVNPIPAATGNRYFKAFDVYPGVPERRTLSREQVFYGWTPAGHDWRQAQSALDAARYPLSIAIMGDRYSNAFLKNGAVPAAVVITEQFEDEQAKERFRSQWEGRYGGPDNAGRTAFHEVGDGDGPVGDAIDVKVLGLSQRDARFVEQHQAALMEVAIGLGVPWSRLDASGRTFDNASQEDRAFLLQTVLPDLQDLEDELNMQVAPFFGDSVCWFDTSGVEALRPAPRWTVADGVQLLKEGALTVNEERTERGLPPIDGGDVPRRSVEPRTAKVGAPSLLLAQLVTINEARAEADLPSIPNGDRFLTPEEIQVLRGSVGFAEPPESSTLPLPSPPPGPPVKPSSEETDRGTERAGRGREPGGEAAPAGEAGGRSGDAGGRPDGLERGPGGGAGRRHPAAGVDNRAPDRTEARRLAWQATDATVTAHERTWERTFRGLFARQQDATLKRLEGSKRARKWAEDAEAREVRQNPADLFDPEFWRAETVSIGRGLFEGVVASAVGRIAGTLTGVSFDLNDRWAQDFIEARANQLAGQVTKTTYDQITAALAEGVGLGEDIPTLAARVRHVFDVASRARSVVISRTEVLSAYNGSAAAAASTLPGDVVGGQEWIATGDGRTRPAHARADGQVKAIGQPFLVGGSMLAYPGDPAGPARQTVQCRCTVGFLTPSEMAATMLPPAKVPLPMARAALRLVSSAESFDEARFREALMEAA